MAIFKCKMCGGTLEIKEGESVVTCDYCGTQQTLPKLSDDKRINLYDRANHFRRSNEYDKAMSIYEQLLNEDNTDAEAYWSIVLCRYGIVYVEDPNSHNRIPTINRVQYTSILADEDYKSALKYADGYQKDVYKSEAEAIEKIQRGILAVSQKEEPFDVFICYKETDASGKRTKDSVLAQDLYYGLKKEGFKVFFSRITLEDKLGTAYEPYIFAALNSAKVMVVLGTKREYFDAVWVKNEWSRFLSLIQNDHEKVIIPAYKDMDPYDLPDEFSHLQAQDMSKLGFMQDLVYGIKKILGKNRKNENVKETVVINQTGNKDAAPLLKRAFIFIEDGDFKSANEYTEKVLDINPECAEAYYAKLLIEFECSSDEELLSTADSIEDNSNYVKALRFSTGEFHNKIECYSEKIEDRINEEFFASNYKNACSFMSVKQYDKAIDIFKNISNYKDSEIKLQECQDCKEIDRKDVIYNNALGRVSTDDCKDIQIKQSIKDLESILDYKDSAEQKNKLEVRLEEWYETQRILKEKAKIKAEEERLRKEREAELKRIKAAKTKRQVKKVLAIVIPVAVVIALAIVLTFTLIIPTVKLNKANELFMNEQYEEANIIYSELGDFKNSSKNIVIINSIKKINDELFGQAIEYMLDSGIPVEVSFETSGGKVTNIVDIALGKKKNNTETIIYSSSEDFKGMPKPKWDGYRFLRWSLITCSYDVTAKEANFKLSLKAEWSANKYIISYDLNGGEISSAPNGYSPDMDDLKICNPTRIGYTFVGWTGTDLKNPTKDLVIKSGSYGDRSYKANWKANEYTITYDTIGGSISSETQKVYYDYNVTLLIPEKKGYEFCGWYLDGKLINDGKWTLTNNATLTAEWKIKTYVITYDLDGGNEISGNPMEYTVDTKTFSIKNPERVGYEFLGWTYEGQEEPLITVSINKGSVGDLNFVAHWKAKTYKITLDANGGVCDSKYITVTYDGEFELPVPSNEGNKFSGWYMNGTVVESGKYTFDKDISLIALWNLVDYSIEYELDGGTNGNNPSTYNEATEINLKEPTKEGYTFLGWTYSGQDTPQKKVFFAVGEHGNKKFVAHWKVNKYTITFDANGGSSNIDSKVVTFDSNVDLPIPTKEGYGFAGWFCGAAKYESGTWKTAKDVTLTAKWTQKKYNVTYDANGGSLNNSVQVVKFGQEISLYVPIRTGYTFEGWYFGDKKVENGIWNIAQDVTLTAKWSAKEYTITYDANGGSSSKDSDKVKFDSWFEIATAERVGYTFDGWWDGSTKYDSCNWKTDSDVKLVASWIPLNGVKYVVNHYVQNIDNNDYTLKFTKNYAGVSDEYVTPEVQTFDGFTSPKEQTVKIEADGSLVVNYYYTRNSYSLTLIANDGTTKVITQKYQSVLDKNSWVTRDGFTFGGWYTEADLVNEFTEAQMPAKDGTIYAYWQEENKPADFTYSGTSEITISSYKGIGNVLHIPAYIGNVKVAKIADYAFKEEAELTMVIVPDTVTSIGNGAFMGCNSITDITLPFVGKNENSSSYTFGCIFGYTTSGSYKMSDNNNTIYQYHYGEYYYMPSSIRRVTITKQTKIPANAFYNCDLIESITIPNGTIKIGEQAFFYCSELNRLNSDLDGIFNIPSGVTQIESQTFRHCSSLKGIQIGNDLKSIGRYAFSECVSLTKVNSNSEYTINLPIGLETIGDYAFDGLAQITTLIVPDTVTSIGDGAFIGCNSITDVTLPFVGKDEKAIKEYALFGYIFGRSDKGGHKMSDNTNIVRQNYEDYYKDYCIPSSIRRVTITKQTKIPYGAFSRCDLIECITVAKHATFAENALYNCPATINYTIELWDGKTVSTSFESGDGSKLNPFVISNETQLAYLAKQVNEGNTFENNYFVISKDLNMGGKLFTPIGSDANHVFKGNIDGANHIIRNLNADSNSEYVGLFGNFAGTISNLGLESSKLIANRNTSGTVYVGMIAYSAGTIENCYTSALVEAKCLYLVYGGGLAGYNAGVIKDSCAVGSIYVTSANLKAYAGGLVGENTGNISSCVSYGDVYAKGLNEMFTFNGGLIGNNTGNVNSSYRHENQSLTRFDKKDFTCQEGVSANYDTMIEYCKKNWSSSDWNFDSLYPKLISKS